MDTSNLIQPKQEKSSPQRTSGKLNLLHSIRPLIQLSCLNWTRKKLEGITNVKDKEYTIKILLPGKMREIFKQELPDTKTKEIIINAAMVGLLALAEEFINLTKAPKKPEQQEMLSKTDGAKVLFLLPPPGLSPLNPIDLNELN